MSNDLTIILKNCQAGDKNAFRKLVKSQKQFAYQVALTYVHSVDDALDISQDAFVKVFKSIKKFDLSKPFSPWFFQIIKNLSYTFLNKRKRTDLLTDFDYLALRSFEVDPLEKETKSENVNNLIKEINALSEDFRIIIIMKEFQEMSYKEISEHLNIPIGTVMSRLYNARQELKKKLLEA